MRRLLDSTPLSSHDIEKVCIMRNEFECLGQNPLAFHLKCLSTDTEEGRYELDSLVKRVIDARGWFVFCESPEAVRYSHVRDELAYIMDSSKEKVWTVDMTADIDVILNQVRMICADIEVFISYAHHDREIIQPLISVLIKKDYSVWTPEDNLTAGGGVSMLYPVLKQRFLYCCHYTGKCQIFICRE